MWLLLLAVAVAAQAPYGPNQLHAWTRIGESQNIGGLGLFQDAFLKGKVHNVQTEVFGVPAMRGLPALPKESSVAGGTPMLDDEATVPARRNRPTPPPAPLSPWTVNTAPELPPRPESKLGGYYDNDGEFHSYDEKKKSAKKVVKEVPHVIKPLVPRQPQAFASPTTVGQRTIVRRVRMPAETYGRQAKAAPQAPDFVYRPKPRPFDRPIEYNNLLAEVEEYDDWLDQREAYQSLFPGRRVSNPYETVPPGSILFANVPPRGEGGPFPGPQLLNPNPGQRGGFVPPPPPPDHVVHTRAINARLPPSSMGNRHPAMVMPRLPNGVTVPPGTIVSIPPGAPIPPGFFPIGAPPALSRVPFPPHPGHVMEMHSRLNPRTPFENPLVTLFSKLFGKPSGTPSVVSRFVVPLEYPERETNTAFTNSPPRQRLRVICR